MSKSKKKQKARERGEGENTPLEFVVPKSAFVPGPVEELPLEAEDDGETLELPAPKAQALDEKLFHDAIEAATRAGVMREEGDRLCYLYNGDTLSLKYMEPTDTEGAFVLIAAFRLGVVYQVRNGTQVVYKAGDWEADIHKLATSERVEPEDEGEE
jgi:hypothetical protein